jgi:site-specific recombinase XerD
MAEDLKLRGLAVRTQEAYLDDARIFLRWAGCPAVSMNEENIRAFISELISVKKLSASTINVYNAALRFLFAVTLDRNLNYRQIPNMKQIRGIPEILTKDELSEVFENAYSLQSKAILMTLYGTGVRLSEACSLRVRDINSESMRVFVYHGNGGKDRYTLLSQTNLNILREYWNTYRPKHPDGWLFLCHDRSGKVNKRAVEDAFKSAVKRAGISKDVSTHTLRACFATHLLEDGADIYQIKQLLGHASINSTTFYLRLRKFDPMLKSPLNTMPKKRGHKTDNEVNADA